MTPTKKLSLLTLSTVLAGGLMTAAMAEIRGERGHMPMLNFDEIDADKDGIITAEEFSAFRAAGFAKADTNADGQINAGELAARHIAEATARAAEMSAMMIKRMDENADGLISPEEMENGPRRATMFERADEDGDGALTKAEVDGAMSKMGRKHGRHGKGHS